MTERSTSGVRGMLAMFEAKKEETSPPSRGRSPALSDATGTSSRPISKVRASFVAVERSGQMGSMVGLRKASDVDSQAGAPRTPSLSAESRINSLDGTAVMDTPSNTKLKGVKEEENMEGRAIPDRPKFGGRVSSKIQAAPKQAAGQKPNPETESAIDLGTVLKGSPFETESIDGQQLETPTGLNAGTGKKPNANATKSSPVKTAVKKFGENVATAAKPNTSTKPITKRPSDISTRTATTSKSGAGPLSAQSAKSDKAPKTPTTPNDSSHAKVAIKKQSPMKPTSPNRSTGAQAINKTTAAAKAPLRKTSRLSLAANKDAAPKADQAGSTGTKAAGQTTTQRGPPTSTAAASSTVSTAASRDRTGMPPPKATAAPTTLKSGEKNSISPKKKETVERAGEGTTNTRRPHGSTPASASSTANTNARPSTAKGPAPRQSNVGVKPKASRQSLAASTTSQNRPSSRASTAGKGQDEGFLARMMRPTQASASKTHDKSDSPPRKSASDSKPKRTSDVSKRETTKPVLSKAQERLLGLAAKPDKSEQTEAKDKKTAPQTKSATLKNKTVKKDTVASAGNVDNEPTTHTPDESKEVEVDESTAEEQKAAHDTGEPVSETSPSGMPNVATPGAAEVTEELPQSSEDKSSVEHTVVPAESETTQDTPSAINEETLATEHAQSSEESKADIEADEQASKAVVPDSEPVVA